MSCTPFSAAKTRSLCSELALNAIDSNNCRSRGAALTNFFPLPMWPAIESKVQREFMP